MTADERRAIERVIGRIERLLAVQADLALYHVRTASGFDRATRSTDGARLAADQARRAAECAHELWALRTLLDGPRLDGDQDATTTDPR